jgi:hypothetical protein
VVAYPKEGKVEEAYKLEIPVPPDIPSEEVEITVHFVPAVLPIRSMFAYAVDVPVHPACVEQGVTA